MDHSNAIEADGLHVDELTEIQRDYLLHARALARRAPQQAAMRLGLSRNAVDRLAAMSREEIRRIATTDLMAVQVRGTTRAVLEGTGGSCGRARQVTADLRALRAEP